MHELHVLSEWYVLMTHTMALQTTRWIVVIAELNLDCGDVDAVQGSVHHSAKPVLSQRSVNVLPVNRLQPPTNDHKPAVNSKHNAGINAYLLLVSVPVTSYR